MNKLQKKVKKFTEKHNIETKIEFRVLDLISEAGELSKEFLLATEYGKAEFVPTKDWESELGDVLFCVLFLANSSEINLNDIFSKTLEKYKDRIEKSGQPGSGKKFTE
ncbi:MAG: MazG-like family protein [Candidatus Cloacimonetes bacterium]|nr:MazG-like family protein [Candidatus Cloacimonadota bacterium]MBS3766762.1 MazG-like family protein [Candidatus Cloacimonadota bacterium]